VKIYLSIQNVVELAEFKSLLAICMRQLNDKSGCKFIPTRVWYVYFKLLY